MKGNTCWRGHEYVTIGAARFCECGIEPSKAHMKGMEAEGLKIINANGGIDRVRAYFKAQEAERKRQTTRGK